MTLVARAGRLPLLLLVVAAMLVPAGPAAAHTELTATSPANGATVPATTDRLVLSFSEQVRADLARVAVTGPTGADAVRGAAGGSGTDVVQPLRTPLAAGTWTAAYRVLSADGHPVSGTLTFTVAPAPAPSLAPTAAPSAATSTADATPPTTRPSPDPVGGAAPAASDDSPVLAVGVGVVVLGALAGTAVVLRRRRADDAT